MSILVRRNPILPVLELVAGGLFFLFFLYMLAAGASTTGCLILVAPVGLLVDGIRRLNSREYLSYSPRSRTIVMSSGRSSEIYRAGAGERFVVDKGQIVIVGAGGKRRVLPARQSSAVREDWQALVTAIADEAAGSSAARS